MNTISYNGVLTPKEFRAKVKMLCFDRGDTVANVEKGIGAHGAYIANLRYVSDYDIRKVAQYFGMNREDFINLHAYEILRLPAIALSERNYSREDWAVLSRVIKEAKDARKDRNKNM